jgi:hypothetical protein
MFGLDDALPTHPRYTHNRRDPFCCQALSQVFPETIRYQAAFVGRETRPPRSDWRAIPDQMALFYLSGCSLEAHNELLSR